MFAHFFPQSRRPLTRGAAGTGAALGDPVAGQEGLVSGAAGTGAREGSPRAALAAGGLHSKAVPCPAARQGLQGSSTASAGSAEPCCSGDAVGESLCLEEWKQSKSGRETQEKQHQGKIPE